MDGEALERSPYTYNVAVGREVAPAQAAGLAQAHARVHAQQYPELDGPVLGPEGLEQAELVLLTEYPRLVPRAVGELKAPVDRRAQPRVVRKLEGGAQDVADYPQRGGGINFRCLAQELCDLLIRHLLRQHRAEGGTDVPFAGSAVGREGRALDPPARFGEPHVQHIVEGCAAGFEASVIDLFTK